MSCHTQMSTNLRVLVLGITATMGACEEEKVTHADTGVALMTVGSIGFMMGLFYLVNHSDEDLRKYSWQVISMTISIFSAVLLFQGVNGILKTYVLEGTEENSGIQLFVGIVHFMVWYLLLQVLLAGIVGAIDTSPFWELFGAGEKAYLPSEIRQKTKLMLECWAVLLGHIAAFAAINMFGIAQQMMGQFVWSSALAVLIAWVLIELLFALLVCVRQKIANADDDYDEREKMWTEHTKETEDDVIGLCISFLIVQVVRFVIIGIIPNVEGEDGEGTPEHTFLDCVYLMAVGVVWIACRFVRTNFECPTIITDRRGEQLGLITTMGAAWCLLFSVQWALNILTGHTQDAVSKVVIALAATAISLSLITVLDRVRDAHAASKRVDKILKSFITTLSVLIGFAWEKCFDTSVDTIADGGRHIFPPVASKFILSCLLCTIVIPAWRFYILPTIMEYEEKEEEEEREGEEGEKKEGGEEEPKDEEAQVTSRDLGAPLLQNEAQVTSRDLGAPLRQHEASSTSAPVGKMNLAGLNVPALKKKVREAEFKLKEANDMHSQKDKEIEELKKKNGDLETSLSAIGFRLQKLQERAEMLRTAKK